MTGQGPPCGPVGAEVVVCRRLFEGLGVYTALSMDILNDVAKHLVDIDEDALDDAKRELGTSTIKDTVNLALRRATTRPRDDVKRRLDVLARADLASREQAWR